MGIVFSVGSARTSRTRPKPSKFGVMTSLRIKIRAAFACRRQRRQAVRHRLHAVAFAQQARQVLAHVRVVIRDDNVSPACTFIPLTPGIRGGHRLIRNGWWCWCLLTRGSFRQPAQCLFHERRRADGGGGQGRRPPRWSAGRCFVPSGMVTMKEEPSPRRLSAWIEPPWSLTNSCTSDKPIPLPSWVRLRIFSIR